MTTVTDARTGVSEVEAELRRDLAACYRMIALLGWDDLISTHASARVAGSDEFLLNPAGLMFDEITASNLVKVDRSGAVVGESRYDAMPAAFVVHSGVMEARPDVNCAIHLHTPDGVAVSILEEGLLPLQQSAMGVVTDLAYHDYEGAALGLDERQRLGADLSEHNYMILRNHGTLAVGPSVGAAFFRIFLLEQSCTIQTRALGMGQSVRMPSAAALDAIRTVASPAFMNKVGEEVAWPAVRRKLDRLCPDYRD